MIRKLQDKAWASLPEEVRTYAKRIYQYECIVKAYNEGANDTAKSNG